MKIGMIRCRQTEDMCASTTCLKTFETKRGAFSEIEENIQLVGINTCGGCPGKKAVTRAELMVKQGANAIALATCITKGSPIGFACPHKMQMLSAIRTRLGADIEIFEYTHD